MTKEEAKRFWLIRYENAKDFSDPHWEAQERREHREYVEALRIAISALSAEAVSREEYEETDGVITIEKQSAKDVGEIKHIVIRSPNYTRYFYNESMPTSAEAVHKPDYSYEADMVKRLRQAEAVQGEWVHDGQNFKGGLDWCHCSVCGQKTSTNGLSMYNFCPNCGADMRGSRE